LICALAIAVGFLLVRRIRKGRRIRPRALIARAVSIKHRHEPFELRRLRLFPIQLSMPAFFGGLIVSLLQESVTAFLNVDLKFCSQS